MANLKEIRNRITSIGSTMQITSAMKMVSAAKLKKAQDAINHMRPYAEKLNSLLQDLSQIPQESKASIYFKEREVSKVLIVVLTSNKGLCGAFNSSIIKKVKVHVEKTYATEQVSLFTIGKKGDEILSKSFNVIENNNEIFDNITFKNVSIVARELINLFIRGDYDKIDIVYNHFKNAATQVITTDSFLPIDPIENYRMDNLNHIFEPQREKIFLELIPKSLEIQLLKTLRDSFAGEHGARMTAMYKATDNAKKLQEELKLTYNKARQAAITNEILEIVGGAEALAKN